jgi:stage V sporulation protein SpoVS
MTFFYDLNKRLAGVANKQELQQLSEGAGDYSAKKAAAGKDIGKPGKAFAKIAKSAGEKYGSKERGEKVAGAVLAKLRKTNEADVEEGNRFTGNLAKARAAGAKQADLDGDGDMEKVREGEVPAQFQKAKKVDVPAYQRKAQGGDWKVTAQDLAKDRERNISDPKGLARLRGENPDNVDEGWDDMLKYVKDKDDEMKTGERRKTAKGEVEKTATGIRHTRSYDSDTGETDTGDDKAAGEKRGRGRPKKYSDDKPRQERVTAKSRKTDRTAYTKKKKVDEYGDFGPMEDQDQLVDRGEYDREGDMAKEQLHTINSAAKELHSILSDDENLPEWVQSKITKAMDYIDTARDYMKSSKADADEPIAEKAVSKSQQQAAGIALAAKRSGKKPAGKGAAAEMSKMPEKELEKFAKTKHKGLPEKKAKKEKEVDENTVAGNVAPAAAAPKGKGTGGFTFGKGIYDSMNRELETMISESMNISMNMNSDGQGGPSQSLTVTATDEDAVKLAALLKMAGLGGGHDDAPESCPTCNEDPCGCKELDENQPENSPQPEIVGDDDPNLQRFAGGLNGPKSTGQATVPVIAGQDDRMGVDGDDDLRRMREMAGIKEAKKPDFLDVDKDGDKKEAFKKAVKDKEEKKVEESIFDLTNSWKEYKG